MRKNNFLNFKQKTALADLIKDNLDSFGEQHFTFLQVADIATEKLGVKVTANNVDAVCRQLDLRWKPKRKQKAPGEAQPAEMDALKRHLAFLYEELGYKVPNELAEAGL